jgi:hypothetical protein
VGIYTHHNQLIVFIILMFTCFIHTHIPLFVIIMSIALDPDWDNKATIIDCSASKKRKQEELEKYAEFTVEEKIEKKKLEVIFSHPQLALLNTMLVH